MDADTVWQIAAVGLAGLGIVWHQYWTTNKLRDRLVLASSHWLGGRTETALQVADRSTGIPLRMLMPASLSMSSPDELARMLLLTPPAALARFQPPA